MNPQQMIVYDEFARNIPGFLPGNDSAQPSGFLSKPMATVCQFGSSLKPLFYYQVFG